MADELSSPSRRGFLRMAPAGLVVGAGLGLTLTTSPEERLTAAVEELKQAWAAIYGEPRVVEVSKDFKYVLLAGKLSA